MTVSLPGKLPESQIHLGLLSEHKPCHQVYAQSMCVDMKIDIRGEIQTPQMKLSIPGLSSTHLIQFQGVVTGLGKGGKKARVRAPEKGEEIALEEGVGVPKLPSHRDA